MKAKIIKPLVVLIALLIFVVVSALTYVSIALPNVGEPEDIKVEITPERVERGSYLANHVASCMDCHSVRDWTKFAAPPKAGTLGQGGEEFSQKFGFPGSFFAKNITPAALSGWTDGEILRAIASGVSRDGKALFPVMPHPNFGKLDREDLYSIIAYLRTIDPIKNTVPESKPDFPMNFIINTIPQPAQYSKRPDPSNIVAYGAYLFVAASCADCHTKKENGTPVEGMELAGGFEFPLPSGGTVRSSNITPDKGTGIGNWTEDMFVSRFKAFSDSNFKSGPVKAGTFNTIMPWTMYANMKTEDIKAIYSYLRTVEPISNQVEKFTPDN